MHTTSDCYGSIRMPQWLWDADISMGAKNVYSLIVAASRGQDHAWPSQDWLAGKLRVSPRSIQRYIKELVGFDLLATTRQRVKGCLRNVYWFLDHELIPKKSAKNFAPRHDNPHDKLSCQEDIKNNDVKSPLTPREQTPPMVSPDEGESGEKSPVTEKEEVAPDQDPSWLAAKAGICGSNPHLRPLLNQLIGQRQEDGLLLLAGPNSVVTGIIERQHGQRIAEALHQAGTNRYRFGVQSADLRRQIEARDQAVELRERVNAAIQASQAELAREHHIARLTPAEQFDILFREYPSPKGFWWAKQTFLRLHRRKELPPLPNLQAAIRRHKADPTWQRECGRWVPNLSNWLAQHRWMD